MLEKTAPTNLMRANTSPVTSALEVIELSDRVGEIERTARMREIQIRPSRVL